MARYRKSDALEMRLAEEVETGGRRFSADLIAKKATGVPGFRMTLAFLELDGPGSVFVDLDPAPGREEARRRAEELQAAPARLAAILAERVGGA
ncbi:MAG: hypothetical protein R6X22_11785 [Gemmatimonadota bacterium]